MNEQEFGTRLKPWLNRSAAEVGEMRHAVHAAGDPHVEFQRSVKGHENRRRHGNGRNQRHDDAPGKVDGEGQQQAKHAAGGAHRGRRRHVGESVE